LISRVSRRCSALAGEFSNGRNYYALHGSPIALLDSSIRRPEPNSPAMAQ
jgi:hypothetical protein